MSKSTFTHCLSILAIGLSFTAAVPAARAENPLERLHNRLFGDNDKKDKDKDKDKDKKKKKKDDDHRDDNRGYDNRNYDNRNYDNRGYDNRGYDNRGYDGRGYDGRGYSEPANRGYSESRSLVADVQTVLARHSLYRGPINGDLNSHTREAIREFQYNHKLAPTGRIDRDLLRSLGL